jgi:hypothetical protein
VFTVAILFIIGTFWFVANGKYESTGLWRHRRMRAGFAWAFAGACIGSFFGVAGMGSAIAGTVPGAVFGYLAASNLMKSDKDPSGGDK